jgi:hypothetical protein
MTPGFRRQATVEERAVNKSGKFAFGMAEYQEITHTFVIRLAGNNQRFNDAQTGAPRSRVRAGG